MRRYILTVVAPVFLLPTIVLAQIQDLPAEVSVDNAETTSDFLSGDTIFHDATDESNIVQVNADTYSQPRYFTQNSQRGRVWEASLSALFMRREYSNVPVVTPLIGGATITAEQFEGGYETGTEARISNGSWEFRYFQIDSFAQTQTQGVGIGANNGLVILTGDVLSYGTDIYSGEFNHFLNDPNSLIRLSAGARYIALDEEVDVSSGGALINRLNTNNDLYGFQLSADAIVWENSRFKLQTDGKAGVYYAHTKLNDTFLPVFTIADTEDEVAFVGEFGLTGSYKVSDWLSLDAGYQFMWLSGVAVAGENQVFPHVVNHGNLLLHGLKGGVTATW